MQDDSFEEFIELVSSLLRRGVGFTDIGKLAAKDSFCKMFLQLLHDGWLLPREDGGASREMWKLLRAEFAYQEGHGPKPLCEFEDQNFVSFLEPDEMVFQNMNLHEPGSHTDELIDAFFPGTQARHGSRRVRHSAYLSK